jgi:hypothetical protein
MPKGDIHVVPGENGWRVETEGANRARSTHPTQAEAWKAGKDVARRTKTEALLHGRDGRIRERSTYGEDPRRSKG